MEDELINLCEKFEVTTSNGLDATKAPRLSQWKEKTVRSGDQKSRRERRLAEIKEKRQIGFQNSRNLNPDASCIDADSSSKDADIFSKDAKHKKRVYSDFKHLLMQSEWLVDVPETPEDWYVAICPVGRRRILNAQFGKTCLYNKGGYETRTTWSSLPGGQRSSQTCETSQTLLDGVHCEKTNTFYILDLLVWNGYYYIDCEYDFRKFWIKQKLDDFENADKNNLKIKLVPSFPMLSMVEQFAKGLDELMVVGIDDEAPIVDGILFYHKETPYVSGATPLVGWLKPEHIKDQFPQVDLHQDYTIKLMDDKRKQYAAPEKLVGSHMN